MKGGGETPDKSGSAFVPSQYTRLVYADEDTGGESDKSPTDQAQVRERKINIFFPSLACVD